MTALIIILSIILLVVVILLVAARLALPSYLSSYVNRVLDQSPEYDGRVGTIDINLWRGEYAVNDLNIVKTTHTIPVPFFESRRVAFTLAAGRDALACTVPARGIQTYVGAIR